MKRVCEHGIAVSSVLDVQVTAADVVQSLVVQLWQYTKCVQANKGTHKTALNDTTSAVATCGQIDIVKRSRDPSQYLHHMQRTQINLSAYEVVSFLVRSEGGQKSYCRWCGGHVRNFRRRFPFPRSVAQGVRAARTCQCALYPPPLAQD